MHLCFLLLAMLWHGWNASSVVQDRGTPEFTVGGKPFFVYGAAFFYERTPRDEWRSDLETYRSLGINTIDLYLIWNWHAPDGSTLDFDGRTNPRRDLHALFSLIHELGFKVIVRPGPVIRNEWRNGGYPDWLLRRPEYNMPLHDILEGRYPATATLQNAHADAAASEWMQNATHVRYAAAWLRSVLGEIQPWSNDVIAIALDDDQGAYLDNNTYPAPHWHAYMNWLKATVQSVTGPRVPLFINTYQMRVTASAPVWAWGNWYQSDAYRIGDHDLAQLAFSTALLQTQTALPVMTSEFQAGWLQGADEAFPRAAAPENTTLALHEMLQQGVHGVVNFPLQDTLNPAGYEAPWANWFYAWDAARTLQNTASARNEPTAEFGSLLSQYGSSLATLSPKADLAIAWLGSAYDPAAMTTERYETLAQATIDQQQQCRQRALTCTFVDLRFNSLSRLRHFRAIVVPRALAPLAMQRDIARTLRTLSRSVAIASNVQSLQRKVTSGTGGIRDAALLVTPDGTPALLDIINPDTSERIIPQTRITVAGKTLTVPAMTLRAGGSVDVPLARNRTYAVDGAQPLSAKDIPLTVRAFAPGPTGIKAVVPGHALAYAADPFRDGSPTFVLDNGRVRLIVSADAGGRVFVFEDLVAQKNLFTTIGGLRDDVAAPLPISARDYIGKYTHPFATGTFNRPYRCVVEPKSPDAALLCTHDAPDLAATPIHFEKEFRLAPNAASFSVRLRASADARSISALTTDDATKPYDLFVVNYPAGQTRWLTFSTQGPPTASANPGGSP